MALFDVFEAPHNLPVAAFAKMAGKSRRWISYEIKAGNLLALNVGNRGQRVVHAPIGSFDANPFGLHDTVGNLFEWCREDLSAYVLAAAPGTGLRAGGPQDNRVVRGGSFTTPSQFARVSKRDSGPPALFNEAIGIRPVRPLER
jgi:formylglycine-generating enzyme required for sulfatase activity